jgi:hypothetical protein
MLRQIVSFIVSKKLGREALLVLGLACALFGNGLFRGAGDLVGRTTRSVSKAWTAYRLQTRANELRRSGEALEELLNCRRTLDEQVCALEDKRAEVVTRLEQSEDLLQTILAVMAQEPSTAAERSRRLAVERDAAVVLGRVQAFRSELQESQTLLDQMAEARVALHRKIVDARYSLRQRTDRLQFDEVSFSGWQAYTRGLEAVRRLEDAERDGERQ